jgi:hypothetical protein
MEQTTKGISGGRTLAAHETTRRSIPTYFYTVCETCGRRLQIRCRYLGKRVECPSCHCELIAAEPSTSGVRRDYEESMLEKANRLLQLLAAKADEHSTFHVHKEKATT